MISRAVGESDPQGTAAPVVGGPRAGETVLSGSELDDDQIGAVAPQRRRDLGVERFDDEALAWSPIAPAPIMMSPLGTALFDLLDGSVTIAELVDDLMAVSDVDVATARQLVRSTIASFERGGMLTSSTTRDPASEGALRPDGFAGRPNH